MDPFNGCHRLPYEAICKHFICKLKFSQPIYSYALTSCFSFPPGLTQSVFHFKKLNLAWYIVNNKHTNG